MSGRFFRGGRHAFQSAMQSTRSNRRPTANMSCSVLNQFSISFTPAAVMMQSAINSQQQQSALTGGSGGGAIGSVRTLSTTAGGSSTGSKGCGAPSCCGGITTAVSGDDAEEPFIGAPSLSSSFSTQQTSVFGGMTTPLAKSNEHSQQNHHTPVAAVTDTVASSSPLPSPPPPRTKCDPYEQGGHPLTTEVVLHHLRMTLDSDWQYVADRKMLVRSFDFRKEFTGPTDDAGSDIRALFDFVAQLGNMSLHSPGPAGHGFYNLNINLRANTLQVMLKTRPLAGISWQDFTLATKTDGVFFRAKIKRDEERENKERKQKQQRK